MNKAIRELAADEIVCDGKGLSPAYLYFQRFDFSDTLLKRLILTGANGWIGKEPILLGNANKQEEQAKDNRHDCRQKVLAHMSSSRWTFGAHGA